MQKNMELTQGRMMSEAVMLTFAKKGLGRQKAHELVREVAIKSHNKQVAFKTSLAEDSTVKRLLTSKELDQVMNPRNYLGTAIQQIDRVIKKTEKERKIRGLQN